MQASQIPIDDANRVRALRALSLLDTLPEERFDRITRLARRALDVPVALISLVDRDRQWFKSRDGLNVAQTSRSISFCGHAILRDGPLIVTDAQVDLRFADNPLVLDEPHIRFYAGQPIHGPGRSRIGTLCVIDRRPRSFSEEEVALLTDLAAMVDRELLLIEQSTTDELTGLSNRLGFTTIATHVLDVCRRDRRGATVVDLALEDLKSFNDTHGRAAGDDVLRLFASLMLKHFRMADVIARFNGVEFAALCGGATAAQVVAPLEQVRRAFRESKFGAAFSALTWSAGFAEFDPQSQDTSDDLLRIAEFRMYRAKVEQSGKLHERGRTGQ